MTAMLYDLRKSATTGMQSGGFDKGDFLSAARFGLRPDTGVDLSSAIESALNAAMRLGKYLLFDAGEYIYTRSITVNAALNRVGLVCLNGEAHFKFLGANLNDVSINVSRPAGSAVGTYVAGFKLSGCKFTQPNRADTGLRNDALEGGAVLRLTNVENIDIRGNRFEHLYGTVFVARHVRNMYVVGNVARDVFKDGFHITGESHNVWCCYNLAEGMGDDAFPVVGYTNLTEKPRFIYHIGNVVRGVRYARAFAYVGCSDVQNTDNFVDGRMPSDIPQQTLYDGSRANTRCGLYIAAEVFGATAAEKTYGNERIKVRGLNMVAIAPAVSTANTLSTGYDAITVYSQNGQNTDIDIQATIRHFVGRGFLSRGALETVNVRLDLNVENNTDPLGLITGATLPVRPAVEFQRTRNVDAKVIMKTINGRIAYADADCSGSYKLDATTSSDVNFSGAGSIAMEFVGASFDLVDVYLNAPDGLPAAAIWGGMLRVVGAKSKRIWFDGKNFELGGTNFGSDIPEKQITSGATPTSTTLPASPATYINVNETPEAVMQYRVAGNLNVSALELVKTRSLGRAESTTGTTVVLMGDWRDKFTTAQTDLIFIDGRGFVLASAQQSTNIAYANRQTTLTFAAVPADTVYVARLLSSVVQTGKQNSPQMVSRGCGVKLTYAGAVDIRAYPADC